MAKQAKKQDDDLRDMRDRYDKARDASSTLYDLARDDIKFVFVPGHQWDSKLKARRGDRPCYEFPKLSAHIRQIVNEMRQSRPQGKVRGVEESDQGLAEIMQGIGRNILSVSNADLAHDVAFEAAVQGGFGCWRIRTDYADPDDFNLDIIVEPIYNAFAVKFDPAAVSRDRRDARYAFVEQTMAKSEFERKYPDADLESFGDDPELMNWRDGDKIRVCEYYYKHPIKRTLLALSDGRVIRQDDVTPQELAAAGVQVVRTREVDDHKVYCRLTNGKQWLTDPYEFPSRFIPLIPVWGNIQNVDGEDYWKGMTRDAKDQQRLHNVHKTAAIEAVSKAPKAPFITKLKWIKGLEHFWNRANSEDFPYLPVNDDADDMPQRAHQAEVPAALLQLAALDNDDIKATTGIYDASLGARSNETSGVAINQRKNQGAVATFNYLDNLSYAIRYEWEILIDMIPRIYDTPRVVRVLGDDGGVKWKQLYQQVMDPQTGRVVVLNDISKGKYDVTVTVGPSYATQRMEAADAFMQLAGQLGQSAPPLAPLLAYEVVRNVDAPGAEEVTTALRKMLVGQGVLPPQEGDQPPAPPPPDPAKVAEVRRTNAQAMREEAAAAKTQAEAQTVIPYKQAEIEKMISEAVDRRLETMAKSGALPGMGAPPPSVIPAHMQPTLMEPPQGGFSLPSSL